VEAFSTVRAGPALKRPRPEIGPLLAPRFRSDSCVHPHVTTPRGGSPRRCLIWAEVFRGRRRAANGDAQGRRHAWPARRCSRDRAVRASASVITASAPFPRVSTGCWWPAAEQSLAQVNGGSCAGGPAKGARHCDEGRQPGCRPGVGPAGARPSGVDG